MNQNIQDNQPQEIDLNQLTKKIGESYQSFLTWIFNSFQFIIKNIHYFIILGLAGLIIGYFLDKGNKIYNHEIYVKPNFGSTDLLYSKIDLLDSKIDEKDTLFFKSIGIKDPKSIKSIKIEPVIDVYGFVNERINTVSNAQNTQNFELLKLLSESSDISKIIKEDVTGRNYSTHLIQINTKGTITKEDVIDPIMNFLNNEEFYKIVQQEYVTNLKIKIIKNEEVIKQIDAILDEFSSKSNSSQKSDKLIYISENTQLNEVITTKNQLIYEQGEYKMQLLSLSKVIKDKSSVINVKEATSIFLKMKFIIPFLLICGFILFIQIRSFYKTQIVKYKQAL